VSSGPTRCTVEGCAGDQYLYQLCKLHADALYYCEVVLKLEEFDLSHFARFVG
jgi:hypothetical protein